MSSVKKEAPLAVALDVNETAYFLKPGSEAIIKTSPHVGPEEYAWLKTARLLPTRELKAQAVMDMFTLVRPDLPVYEGEFSDTLGLELQPFSSRIKSVPVGGDKSGLLLNLPIDNYEIDLGVKKGLEYGQSEVIRAAQAGGVRAILNSGAKDQNASALLTMVRRDGVLPFFNPDLVAALRPQIHPENIGIPGEISTPGSKGAVSIWMENGLRVKPMTLENSPEPREVLQALGYIVGINTGKREAELMRRQDTPDFVQSDLSSSPGITIYRATMHRLIDWHLGLNNIQIRLLQNGGPGEFEFVEPKILFLAAKPDPGEPQVSAS